MLVIAVILAFIVSALIFAVVSVYFMVFCSNRKYHPAPDSMPKGEQYEPYAEQLIKNVRWLAAQPCEKVYITSHDGLKLAARYYEADKNAPTIIMFHGYRSTALRDASGAAPYGIRHGFNVLLPDQRSHGESEGRNITFGVKERYDCLEWVKYIVERNGKYARIMLQGLSMGASTVMMATGIGLPENVRGVIADCGFTTPEAIILKVAKDKGFHVKSAAPFIRFTARFIAGFDIRGASALTSVAAFDRPVFLIHGDDDRFVPCDMSREIVKASKENCRLIEFGGAGHGMSYYVDTEKYISVMDEMSRLLIG